MEYILISHQLILQRLIASGKYLWKRLEYYQEHYRKPKVYKNALGRRNVTRNPAAQNTALFKIIWSLIDLDEEAKHIYFLFYTSVIILTCIRLHIQAEENR